MEHNEILYRIKTEIKKKDPSAEIFLYGSRARGDSRPDSDWDILIITQKNKITLEYESEIRDPILDIELETGQIISLIVYSKSDWTAKMMFSPFFSNIEKEGIKI